MGNFRKGLTAIALFSLLLGLLSLASPATATPRSGRAPGGGELMVTVIKPSGLRAQITVRGPGGYQQKVVSTKTLTRLRPGDYRITAASVRSSAGQVSATISEPTVRIGLNGTGQTTVDYDTTLSNQVRTLAPSTIRDFVPPSEDDDTGRMVTTTSYPVGTILASGMSTQTPDGALVKVVTVGRSGRHYVLGVEQSTLQEAIPQGDFTTSFTTELEDPAADGAWSRGSRAQQQSQPVRRVVEQHASLGERASSRPTAAGPPDPVHSADVWDPLILALVLRITTAHPRVRWSGFDVRSR